MRIKTADYRVSPGHAYDDEVDSPAKNWKIGIAGIPANRGGRLRTAG
ncbi:MAG: hypothetical protein ABIT71_04715 [Vicinamibacteraceae bacterium]